MDDSTGNRAVANQVTAHGTVPGNTPLSGAVNVVSADGHAQLIRLPRLWLFTWHKDYVPPANPRR